MKPMPLLRLDLTATIRSRTGARIFRVSRTPSFTLLTSLLLTVASFSREAPAQLSAPSQYDVQAVYLFNFAKFVRWPAGAEREPLTICTVGQKEYADTLTKIVGGEHVDARPLAVRAIQRPEDATGCDILFIGATAKERLDTLLAATAGKPVLTVSDIPGFLDRGGMIQFLIIDKRVRFSVNLRPVARNGISLSSELLKVAITVNGKPTGGGPP